MIYLTGDVHTTLPGHWEQKIAGKEVDSAKKYLEILKKYKISSTLFLNGKCFDEDREKVRELKNYDVEIGGHTYDNFGNMGAIKSYLYRKIWGCIYGSESYQKKDIQKTKRAFEKAGMKMTSWRTHSFGSNGKTGKILKIEGVKYVSDIVGEVKPFEKDGIFHLPINIPVDVVTIAYGEYKPESKNPFASCVKGRIQPEEWFEIIKKRITYNEKNKIDSILLIHPITMAVLDNFKLFEEIAKFLSKYKSKKISEFENK
ncbi:Polysaccharide deacetylase [uncultured archaeon]|nr:Polysaccharide deacetylase [uncultured archaeon]